LGFVYISELVPETCRVCGVEINVKEKKMRTKKIVVLLAVIVTLLAVGCVSGGNTGNSSQSRQTPDIFADEKDGVLTVQNQTGVDIVLFAGRVQIGILLGGIRANSVRNFDISKILQIPEKGAFIIRGIPVESYRQKGDSITESDVLYTGLVVFDLKDTKKIVKLIPVEIDETMSFSVFVSNNSQTVCELRLNAPDGPAITVLPPFVRNREIWIKPSEFGQPSMIWPIFFSVDHNGTIQESVPPAGTRGSRVVPAPRGGSMAMLQFDNPAEGNGQINLLFESVTR